MNAPLCLEPALHSAVFDLVLATARVHPTERGALAVRGAQIALGLVDWADALGPDPLAALVSGAAEATAEWRLLAGTSERDRTLAYAAAVWTAHQGGQLASAHLPRVRRALRLPARAADLAEHAARAATGELPAHRSFARLLVEVARGHAAPARAAA